MQKKQTRSVTEETGKIGWWERQERPQASGSPTAVRYEWQSISGNLAEVDQPHKLDLEKIKPLEAGMFLNEPLERAHGPA